MTIKSEKALYKRRANQEELAYLHAYIQLNFPQWLDFNMTQAIYIDLKIVFWQYLSAKNFEDNTVPIYKVHTFFDKLGIFFYSYLNGQVPFTMALSLVKLREGIMKDGSLFVTIYQIREVVVCAFNHEIDKFVQVN